MFTIFGATGHTGSVVAETLLSQGKKVRAVVRSHEKGAALAAKGAELHVGSIDDAAQVAAALKGSKGAYFLVPPEVTSNDMIARGRHVVGALIQALQTHPVPHVVLLSSVGAQEPSGTGPIVLLHNAEKALSAVKGTAFTFVRAAYFMENVLQNAHPMKNDGVLPVFGGGEQYPFPMVATRDIGRVSAEALLSSPTQTSVIELSGPQEYSFADAATAASSILGRPVKATPLPIESMVPTLTRFGYSQHLAGLYRELTEGIGKGLVKFEGKGTRVRGRVPLEEVLSAMRV